MRAIVVNHSKAMRNILKRVLQECGYDDVVEAPDGRNALLAMENGDLPSLALVDSNLREMTDLEFVEAARSNPAYSDVKVMVISGEGHDAGADAAMAAGADECVQRPFTKQMLVEKLEVLKSSHG
jgi:two-component system chemotaxis response regulator CheY